VRLALEYDLPDERAPQTLVAKFPRPSPGRPNWRGREILFYEQFADQIEMPVPRCYFVDADQGYSVLLLEDLTPARNGDPITRATLSNAELAVRELARFHATWWEDPRLERMAWLARFDGARLERMMAGRWDPFLRRAGHRVPNRHVIDRLQKHFASIADRLYCEPPRTLLHGDYQPNNLFFATPQGGNPFTVIDWQLLSHGCGVLEVAFLLCRGTPLDERREIEMRLLGTYHTTLVENGVRAYTFEQCFDDYRLSMLSSLIRTVSMIGGRLSPIHQPRFLDIFLPRIYAAVIDLDAVDLLPE
jgi:aminoglycoside/choline kinase family phosphotransferase